MALILASQPFVDSPRLAEFLRYVVNETLSGRAGRIKGFTIAQDVFGRDDLEDAQTSTVVRVEAGRLRRYLNDYYSGREGHGNSVNIEIPKGTYVPNFQSITPVDRSDACISSEGEANPQTQPGSAHRHLSNTLLWVGILGAAIVLAAGFLISFDRDSAITSIDPVDQSTGTTTPRPSIAVMPFESSVQDQQAGIGLARGLTEDIITDLSRLSELDVVAISSVQAVASDADLATIAKRLNVTHVLRGSIRGTPSRVRVTAQLYSTQTGTQVWANRFDRLLDDTLEVEDELAVKITEGLSLELDPVSLREKIRRGTGNLEAYALFNQALHLVNPPTDAGRLKVSRAAFERIIDMDPGFAGGYAGVAYTSSFLAFWGHTESPREEIDKAIEFANKAIDKDDAFGIAYSALAFAKISLGEFDRAVSTSALGVARQPNDPYVNAYHGFLLAANGQADKGIGYLKRALFLDPLNPRTPFLNILGYLYILSGEPQKGLDSMLRNLEHGGPVSPGNMTARVAALVSLGRVDEARELAKSIQRISSGFNFPAWENWVKRSFRYQKDKDKLFDPLRKIGLI